MAAKSKLKKPNPKAKSAAKTAAKKPAAKAPGRKAGREEISSDLRKVALAHALRRLK